MKCANLAHRRADKQAHLQYKPRNHAAIRAQYDEYSHTTSHIFDHFLFVLQHPASDTKAIKAAYYELMRSYHPDQSSSIDTNEFCALLNEIYRVSSWYMSSSITGPQHRPACGRFGKLRACSFVL